MTEIRVQLRDTGDASDPFSGVGIDDNTVVVAAIPGVRSAGANVLLFENGRLLSEGIDYTFAYDTTGNAITLTPLAGVFRNDRAYRVELNNRDRNVLVLPDSSQLADGAQIEIVDTDGGAVVFEFERGLELTLPTPPTIVVPPAGTEAGGLRDGDVFQLRFPGSNPVTFEFDADGVVLPESNPAGAPSRVISLPSGRPGDQPGGRPAFLNGIAQSIAEAINRVLGPAAGGATPVFAVRDGSTVRLAAVGGLTLDTQGGGLNIDGRGTVLRTGALAGGTTGLIDGQTFTITTGGQTVSFEIDSDGVTAQRASQTQVNVTIPANASPAVATRLLAAAITASSLRAPATATGREIQLSLPADGVVDAAGAAIEVLAVSPASSVLPITVADVASGPILIAGTVFTVTSASGTAQITVVNQTPPAGSPRIDGQFVVLAGDSPRAGRPAIGLRRWPTPTSRWPRGRSATRSASAGRPA